MSDEAAKVEALCDVLRTALPELVAVAFTTFKKTDIEALTQLVPGLSDAEWDKLKRNEDQRRKESKP